MNHHVEPSWRTPVNKKNDQTERKGSWKHKVKPCNDIDGASRRDNAEKLGTPEKKRWNKFDREFWWGSGIRNWIYSMKQE